MIHCKDCAIGLEDCDFCKYAIHDCWKDDQGEIIFGGPIGCMLHTELDDITITPCDDFHCFREPFVGRRKE